LVADGVGARKYTGIITQTAAANSDTFILNDKASNPATAAKLWDYSMKLVGLA
jgi:hypothetical protein